VNKSSSELSQLINQARHLVVFSGAGISAESGIPTYRGADGLWQKYDPDKYANIDYFRRDPSYYWHFFQEVRYPLLKRAQPNPGHLALARLEERGRLQAIITQNIDGLHQLAGSQRVLELHGNTRRIECLRCHKIYLLDQVYQQLESQLPPLCAGCGGPLKPQVVFFGESLPQTVLLQAVEETKKSDLFIVIGSSLVVQPAASLPLLAQEQGARLVIINAEPTPLDPLADLVFHHSASEILATVI
jgi:NAD-dependent deacetylase